MKPRKVTQREFERIIKQFESRESFRSALYPLGLRLLNAGFQIEAYSLILATWNFAGLRYVMKTFSIGSFQNAIAATTPRFNRLASYRFETVDFDSIADDVMAIYAAFCADAKQTGASKIMHFRLPKLFVMWDTDIRADYGFRYRTKPDHYLGFQKRMQSEFGRLTWTRTDKTFPKAIDEYNYLTAHPE